MVQIKNTYPATLLHILEDEYEPTAESKILEQFIFAFGELACVKDRHMVDIITKRLETLDLHILHNSLTALLKIDVHDNGLRYVNKQVPAQEYNSCKLNEIITGHLAKLPPFFQTVSGPHNA